MINQISKADLHIHTTASDGTATVPELLATPDQLAELFIVSSVTQGDALTVGETDNHKCGRCWRYLPEVEEDGELCARCEDVLDA